MVRSRTAEFVADLLRRPQWIIGQDLTLFFEVSNSIGSSARVALNPLHPAELRDHRPFRFRLPRQHSHHRRQVQLARRAHARRFVPRYRPQVSRLCPQDPQLADDSPSQRLGPLSFFLRTLFIQNFISTERFRRLLQSRISFTQCCSAFQLELKRMNCSIRSM